jgi:hypothetical protein
MVEGSGSGAELTVPPMSEAHDRAIGTYFHGQRQGVEGYLAHKKTPTP